MRIALGVEYDGTDFCGWQIQTGVRTVQECVEKALSKVADHPLRVICAGRTDTGVHALGQVIHMNVTAQRSMHSWVFGANTNLPKDVAVLWAQAVNDEFHARFSARARHYRYIIFNRAVRPAVWADKASWEYRQPLDVERMRTAAQFLIGEHDFSSYRARSCQAKSPVRTVSRLTVRSEGAQVILEISANAFLQHMVRNIAGVLMAIGCGKQEPEWARTVLEARDRIAGGVTAPPQGLYLCGVDYPAPFSFNHHTSNG